MFQDIKKDKNNFVVSALVSYCTRHKVAQVTIVRVSLEQFT